MREVASTLVIDRPINDLPLPGDFQFVADPSTIMFRDTNIFMDMNSPIDRKMELLRWGVVPHLGNGFSYVIDHRPAGQEHLEIPPQQFTKYFSEGHVPMASFDDYQSVHDLGHVKSYHKMFSYQGFAELTLTASNFALSDPSLCEIFTKAMDSFSANIHNLMDRRPHENERFHEHAAIGARVHLRKLIALRPDTDTLGEAESFNALWREMDLAWTDDYLADLPPDPKRKVGRLATQVTDRTYANRVLEKHAFAETS